METKQTHKSYDFEFKLSVIKCAKEIGNRAASRKFNVDEKQVRSWKKQELILVECMNEKQNKNKMKTRKRLPGAGRKRVSNLLDTAIFDWILEQREKSLRVSRRNIQDKARELFPKLENTSVDDFKASNGWLQKFMKRYQLFLRRTTTLTQTDPNELNNKIVSYIINVARLRKSKNIFRNDSIIAMDEIAIFFDTTSNTTSVASTESKSTAKDHGKEHVTIVLAAKADGTKLKPFVVFKQALEEVEKLQQTPDVFVRSSTNGWMNEELTIDWLKTVFTKFSSQRRLLVWDSYRCHINEKTSNELKHYNTDVAVIPGGCTKYIHAPDVSWNKPFKQTVTEFHEKWMFENKTFEENLKAPSPPPKEMILKWIVEAWKLISIENIIKSFKACALNICTEGEEDELINCIKPGEACEKAADLLREARRAQECQELLVEEDLEEAEGNEVLIDSDIESDEIPHNEAGNGDEEMKYDHDD